MVCFKRTIFSKTLIVYIEAKLYANNSRAFDCIFSTFNTAKCEIIFGGSMYIHSMHKYVSKERLTQYTISCNESNNQWVLRLIGSLEDWYADILNCTIIHGSCVRLNGKNVLLIGERKSGKTTLTKYLVYEKCATYLDDDCIYIVCDEYLGFNMPISVRQKILDSSNENIICPLC